MVIKVATISRHERSPQSSRSATAAVVSTLAVKAPAPALCSSSSSSTAPPVRCSCRPCAGSMSSLQGRSAQGRDRLAGRRQGRVVEARLGKHQLARDRRRGVLVERVAPGHFAGKPVALRLDRRGHVAEQPVELARQRAVARLMLENQAGERLEAAQGRIVGQRRQERLRRGQAVGQRAERVDLEIEQSVAGKERLPLRIVDRREVGVVGTQRVGQSARGGLNPLRRPALNHRHDRIGKFRERLPECAIVLAERHFAEIMSVVSVSMRRLVSV